MQQDFVISCESQCSHFNHFNPTDISISVVVGCSRFFMLERTPETLFSRIILIFFVKHKTKYSLVVPTHFTLHTRWCDEEEEQKSTKSEKENNIKRYNKIISRTRKFKLRKEKEKKMK